MDWFVGENLNRKPMGFYHQIWSGFPVKIFPSSNSNDIWHFECGEHISENMGTWCLKKQEFGVYIYSVYIRIPYTAWLIITCLWRMHQEHAGPCHVARKPALWTQPLNLDQDVTWNQGVHSEEMGISGLWGPKRLLQETSPLRTSNQGLCILSCHNDLVPPN